ncbi:DALR anticodon-binding domain-containing protein [Okeania sp.]|uniref:DALR anticodon-binding domain-containing protein n=1 Tax=Okeania sp. TaxID=3100323 RepID=UPI002B4B4DCE|nr:DALR anticodon-binding domain-containing protein [Okeania sp.]MEB3341344.1 DALR anticodon-binding domain-containing protein [Okeania sp.]
MFVTKLSFQCIILCLLQKAVRSCPVASVLYREGKEEALREEKTLYGDRYFSNFYTNNTNRHDIIPIKQIRDVGGVTYKSAIALKLASVWQQPAINIATELAKYCQEIINTEGKKNVVDFRMEVIASGIIYVKITNSSIANWLSNLTSVSLKSDRSKFLVDINLQSDETINRTYAETGFLKEISSFEQQAHGNKPGFLVGLSKSRVNLFPIQYSHARCCSLLRMGERDGLITLMLTTPENYSQYWLIQTPKAIPWQKINGELQFLHHAEYELIAEIASTLDCIYCVSITKKSINWVKVANSLSNAFQTFYRQCRIWGEVKVETPELAKARLGLVLVTQSLLRFLLEEKLDTEAPLEL